MQLPDCDKCGNTRHIKEGKYYRRCDCFSSFVKKKRREQFSYSGEPCSQEDVDTLLKLNSDLTIYGKRDEIDALIAGMHAFAPDQMTFKVALAYELMEAYLGASDFTLSNYYSQNILFVKLGFSSLTNKIMGVVLENVWETRRSRGNLTWWMINVGKHSTLEKLNETLVGLYGEYFMSRILDKSNIQVLKI